jgi:hypothetical protein
MYRDTPPYGEEIDKQDEGNKYKIPSNPLKKQ